MSRTEKLAVQPDLGAGGSECISVPTSQATALLSSLGNFLTVAIHSILFHRALYPAATFLTARAYNLPVHQSRHPGVCAWIRDAVSASLAQIRAGSVRSLALVIHAPNSFEVLERWIFDLQTLPASWGDRDVPMGAEDWAAGQAGGLEGPNDETVNWTDVNEGLRGALSRIAQAGQGRPDLPQGSTFTLAVELRDESQAPIKHPQIWIPSQPNLQTSSASSHTPIRSVQAGPLFFECWVEQGKTGSGESSVAGATTSSRS